MGKSMNLIDAISDMREAYSPESDRAKLYPSWIAVGELVAAYDALAPDWDSAPEWAQWYAVDANGRAVWMKRKPKCGYPRNPYWENHVAYIPVSDYFWAVAGEVTLADGIDWRQCLWQRPEASGSNE